MSLRTPAEFEAFRERFWERRDAEPALESHAVAAAYFARVADADQLYGEPGVRGAVTDRGGVLILLGPPNILRHRQKRVPALGRGPSRDGARSTVQMTEEVWVYLTQDLPPALRARLRDAEGPLADISVTFVIEGSGARLTAGKDYLRLARRALVSDNSSP